MPPWKPHPGAGVFLDAPRLCCSRRRRSSAGRRLAAPGRSAPIFPRYRLSATAGSLASPTSSVRVPEPIDIPADGPDIYRILPAARASDRDLIVAGLEFRPGTAESCITAASISMSKVTPVASQVRDRAASPELARATRDPWSSLSGAWGVDSGNHSSASLLRESVVLSRGGRTSYSRFTTTRRADPNETSRA